MPIPVVVSDAHLAHDGLIELVRGDPVPCYESPARAVEIERALRAADGYLLEPPIEHGQAPITAVHAPDLVDLLEHVWTDALVRGFDGSRPLIPDTFATAAFAAGHDPAGMPASRVDRLGRYCFDTATPIVEGTYAAARAAVDVALTAADRVVGGAPLAYGLCRPPGHHAGRRLFGGYCYFNNPAIVAQSLCDAGATRVAILDVDYHHGNGTQQIFWERGDVFYLSLHGDPRAAYPYFSGYASELGAGAGAGRNRNFPLAPHTEVASYAAALGEALRLIAEFDPDAPLVLSLGLDTFERDPISDLALRTPDYRQIGSMIAELGRPVIALQEGGYAVDAIGANAVSFLAGLRG
ncbi:MAG: histone deacetylase family protein [Chloroflexota bacterium]|nr:histone deacetylase family protein [Chloroflexota bacterium]